MNRNDNNNPGCLMGILQIFALNKVYDWCQAKFGTGRGGCIGCGCGAVLFCIFIMVLFSIIFGTDWTHVSF